MVAGPIDGLCDGLIADGEIAVIVHRGGIRIGESRFDDGRRLHLRDEIGEQRREAGDGGRAAQRRQHLGAVRLDVDEVRADVGGQVADHRLRLGAVAAEVRVRAEGAGRVGCAEAVALVKRPLCRRDVRDDKNAIARDVAGLAWVDGPRAVQRPIFEQRVRPKLRKFELLHRSGEGDRRAECRSQLGGRGGILAAERNANLGDGERWGRRRRRRHGRRLAGSRG